ncbi:MAG: GGDEF domain-containing protein [Kistimonas sp.]|nr:GGDEF domain-containing protein [Kistimonas sp.]
MEVQRLELEKHQQSLALLASQDHLTKLANRRSLLAFLRKAVAGCCAAEEARYAAVILLDIDSFKQVNDTLGHSAGDRLLCSVARRLLCPFDVKSDVKSLVARWGGDEFVIAFDGISHPDRAFLMAKKIRARICLPYSLEGKVIQIGVSVGVSTSLEAGPTETRLLSAADKAMYTAKRTGRGIWSACLSEQKPTNSSGAAGQLNPVQDTDWTKFQQTV